MQLQCDTSAGNRTACLLSGAYMPAHLHPWLIFFPQRCVDLKEEKKIEYNIHIQQLCTLGWSSHTLRFFHERKTILEHMNEPRVYPLSQNSCNLELGYWPDEMQLRGQPESRGWVELGAGGKKVLVLYQLKILGKAGNPLPKLPLSSLYSAAVFQGIILVTWNARDSSGMPRFTSLSSQPSSSLHQSPPRLLSKDEK